VLLYSYIDAKSTQASGAKKTGWFSKKASADAASTFTLPPLEGAVEDKLLPSATIVAAAGATWFALWSNKEWENAVIAGMEWTRPMWAVLALAFLLQVEWLSIHQQVQMSAMRIMLATSAVSLLMADVTVVHKNALEEVQDAVTKPIEDVAKMGRMIQLAHRIYSRVEPILRRVPTEWLWKFGKSVQSLFSTTIGKMITKSISTGVPLLMRAGTTAVVLVLLAKSAYSLRVPAAAVNQLLV